jgi:hypothetical protein
MYKFKLMEDAISWLQFKRTPIKEKLRRGVISLPIGFAKMK